MSTCVIRLAALLLLHVVVLSSLPCASAFTVSKHIGRRTIPFHSTSKILPQSPFLASAPLRAKAKTTTALPSSSSQIDAEFTAPSAKEKALGVLVLLTVPLAWGTYAPVVKYVYEMDPPVPGFVFSTAYYLIASASLLTLMRISSTNTNTDEEHPDVSENESRLLPIKGGIELGSYLFLGNCLQVVGLETVPADRAAFLVQLTTIMVPIFQAAFARDILAISLKTWVACLLAFSGVVIMGFDGKDLSLAAGTAAVAAEGSGSSASSTVLTSLTSSFTAVADTFTGGDVLIVLAAVAYTMHVVRLGKYAQSTTPLRLAASKASVEAVLSLTLISVLVLVHGGALGDTRTIPEFLAKTSGEVTTYLSTFGGSLANAEISTLLPAFGACLWTGWVTCAYTIYAQSFGQRRVSPTDANLIYTTQPLFSSMFAFVLLGETLGKAGVAGGSLIAVALWLTTVSSSDEYDEGGDLSS